MSSYQLKPNCNKKWAIHFSKRKKQNYFYNRITGKSYWERPPEVTDDDIIQYEDILRVCSSGDIDQSPELLQKNKIDHVIVSKQNNKVSDQMPDIIEVSNKEPVKSKQEQDSGVVDLYNDLSGENGNSLFFFDNKPAESKKEDKKFSPGLPYSTGDFSIDYTPEEIRRFKSKNKRSKLNSTLHDRLYARFLFEDNRRSRRKKSKSGAMKKKLLNDSDLKKCDCKQIEKKQDPNLASFERVHGKIVKRSFNLRSRNKNSNPPDSNDCKLLSSSTSVKGETNNFAVPTTSLNSKSDCDYDVDLESSSLSPLESYCSDEEIVPHNTSNKLCYNSCNRIDGNEINDSLVLLKKNNDKQKKVNISPVPSTSKENKSMEVELPSVTNFQTDEYEEMDWEVTVPENEVLKDIGEVRKELATSNCTNKSEVVLMEICEDSSVPSTADTLIVVDTNVFISNLRLVKSMTEITLPDGSGIIIVVPWQVMQELDKLKSRLNIGSISGLAIDYICKALISKHPRIIAQSSKQHFIKTDAMKHFEVPDDAILNCCLQLINQDKNVILCTNDKNLLAKAIASEIRVLTAQMFAEELNLLPDVKNNKSFDDSLKIKQSISSNSCSNEFDETSCNRSLNYSKKGSDDGSNCSTPGVIGNLSFQYCTKSILSSRVKAAADNRNNNFVNKCNTDSNKQKRFKRDYAGTPSDSNTSLNSSEREGSRSITFKPSPSGSSESKSATIKSSKCNIPLQNSAPKQDNSTKLQNSDVAQTETSSSKVSGSFQILSSDYLKNKGDYFQGSISKPCQSEDLMLKFQESTNKFILNVLVKGMSAEYGTSWQKRVAKEPPWSISDLYYCLSKHWMAVSGRFISASMKEILHKLCTRFQKSDVLKYNRADIRELVELSLQLCSEFNGKFPALVNKYRDSLNNLLVSNETPDVTLSTIINARETVKFFCSNFSKALETKDLFYESKDLSTDAEQMCSLDALTKKLPKMNSFIIEFIASSERLLQVPNPEQLTISDQNIERLFLALNGFLDVSDPDFSVDRVLEFLQRNWKTFSEIVSEFVKLKFNLAKYSEHLRIL